MPLETRRNPVAELSDILPSVTPMALDSIRRPSLPQVVVVPGSCCLGLSSRFWEALKGPASRMQPTLLHLAYRSVRDELHIVSTTY